MRAGAWRREPEDSERKEGGGGRLDPSPARPRPEAPHRRESRLGESKPPQGEPGDRRKKRARRRPDASSASPNPTLRGAADRDGTAHAPRETAKSAASASASANNLEPAMVEERGKKKIETRERRQRMEAERSGGRRGGRLSTIESRAKLRHTWLAGVIPDGPWSGASAESHSQPREGGTNILFRERSRRAFGCVGARTSRACRSERGRHGTTPRWPRGPRILRGGRGPRGPRRRRDGRSR